MKPIKTQIEELEREIEQGYYAIHTDELKAKLQTLKECQKMFDDYNKKLKDKIKNPSGECICSCNCINRIIDKLSKEVMGE